VAKDYIHNQYYDALFEQWLQKALIDLGLSERYMKSVVELNGKKINISKELEEVEHLTFGPENDPPVQLHLARDFDQIYDWDRDFFTTLQDKWRIDQETYVLMRNALIKMSQDNKSALLTPLLASRAVALTFAEADQLLKLLESKKLINQYVFDATDLGPQILPNIRDDEPKVVKTGNSLEVYYQDPLLVKAASLEQVVEKPSMDRVRTILQTDPKLKLELQASNAVCARFENDSNYAKLE